MGSDIKSVTNSLTDCKINLKRDFDQDNDTPVNKNLGRNCFNPIGNTDREVPEKMKPMVVTCADGCYSLAYEIKGIT